MIDPRVGHHVHDVRGVAKLVELIECKKTRAREIRFLSQHAIQLNRMPHRFMNLQTQLAAAQNQRTRFLRALRRRVQCHRFFRNHRRMFQQIQRLHQLIPLQRVLPSKTVRIRPLLNFVALKRSGHNPAAGNHFPLMNPRPDA